MAFNLAWFPFYPRDFFSDEKVVLMDNAHIGAFMRLLAHQWFEGSIPSDRHELARLAHVQPKEFDELWKRIGPCFVQHLTAKKRLLNVRLDEERCRAANIAKIQQESGRRGGLKKAENRLKIARES